MSRRFDYVIYDEDSAKLQAQFKSLFAAIEDLASESLPDSRPKSLLITALEEAYMWTGKAIRDAQIDRGSNPEDAPNRSEE